MVVGLASVMEFIRITNSSFPSVKIDLITLKSKVKKVSNSRNSVYL